MPRAALSRSKEEPTAAPKVLRGAAPHGKWSLSLLKMQQLVDRAGGNLQKVMDVVVRTAIDLIPHAGGAVVEITEGADLVYRAASGTSASRLGYRIPRAGSFSGLAVEQGISLVCRDAETDDRVDRIACRHVGLRSMVVVPLPHQDGYAGVLKVYSAFPNAFTDQDVLTAHLLAGPLAVGFATANEAVAVAERAIADRRFTATFEQAAVGIAHVAHTGHFLLVNRRFCEILGYPPEVLTGLSFQQITHPDDLETDLGYLRTLVAGKIPNYSIEKRYLRADGSALWIKLTVSLVRDGVGGTDFFVAVVEDIDARKRAELESTQDPLTGLLNRRGALGRLERELGRAGLSGDSTIIVFLDLDCFKAVNDSLGHSQGDKCLARVATALTKASRPRDLVCRLGGDEFLVALLGLSAAEAPPVLERLLEAVREEATDGSCPVRASMGAIALSGGVAVPVDQAVAAADRLMYAAKAAGKNCYILESWSSNALAAA